MTEVTSQAADISADTVDTNTQETDTQDTGDTGATKKKSGVPKLLADKNAAEAKVLELEQQLADLQANSISKDNLDETITLLSEEKNVLSQLDEEGLEKYNAMKEEHKTLRPSQIAQLMGINQESSQPNKLSISGNTPASLKKKATLADKSDEELRAGAEEELRSLLGN